MDEARSMHGSEERIAWRVSVGEPEAEKPLGRQTRSQDSGSA